MKSVARKMETYLLRVYPLPDAILFLYLLCIARQYLWFLGDSTLNNVLAWSVSAIIGFALLALLSRYREGWEGTPSTLEANWHNWFSNRNDSDGTHTKASFDWLWIAIVVVPLLAFFFLRAALPALDFDHLNYHIVNTERALRGWPMIAGDFFPGTLLVNPAPDMAFGVLKYVIGYRLAPLLNIGVLLWTANVLNELLTTLFSKRVVRYSAILFIIATDQACYLANIFMVDLLSLPLLLTATLLVIRLREQKSMDAALCKIALFLGITVAFKLTNCFFVIPIVMLCLFELIRLYREQRYLPGAKTLVLISCAGVLPSAFFFAYMFQQTGNPLFPYYNAIFKSPLMVATNYKDPYIGGKGFVEKLFWPIISFIYPDKLSAIPGATIYSGRLNFGFVLSAAVLFFKPAPAAIRKVCFIMFLGCCLWSFGSGDLRYALIGEVFGGILCCFIFKYLYEQAKRIVHISSASLIKARIAFCLVIGFALLQTSIGVWMGLIHFNCATADRRCDRIMQPAITNRFSGPTYKLLTGVELSQQLDLTKSYDYQQEARYFLRDRRAQDFFSESDKAQFRDVEIWINSSDQTSGYMSIASPDVPMISVSNFLHLFHYMQSDGARSRVREMLAKSRGKHMYTLVQSQGMNEARRNLSMVGLTATSVKHVSLPLYSPNIRANLELIQLSLADSQTASVATLSGSPNE